MPEAVRLRIRLSGHGTPNLSAMCQTTVTPSRRTAQTLSGRRSVCGKLGSRASILEEANMSVTSALIPLMAVAITLGGGWLVTTRVTDRWDKVKKRREMDLAAASEFQRLYGEFFAAWKSWNSAQGYLATTRPSTEIVWECLKRAAATEGGIEALLAKVASERFLSQDDIDVLGGVRQGFQALREAIRAEQALAWHASNIEQYSALKGLCAYVSGLLANSPQQKQAPDSALAAANFQHITDNKHERMWIQTARRLNLTANSYDQSRGLQPNHDIDVR